MAELTFISSSEAPTEAEALDAYSNAVISVAERLAPSVANLRVSHRGRRGRVLNGGGSAVVITPDGVLLTSAHVVRGRARVAVRRGRLRSPFGSRGVARGRRRRHPRRARRRGAPAGRAA